MTVLIGKGDGTFTTHVNHTVPIYPYDIATGDFNGDGKLDLVGSFNTPGAVSILLGKWQPRFHDLQGHADRRPSLFLSHRRFQSRWTSRCCGKRDRSEEWNGSAFNASGERQWDPSGTTEPDAQLHPRSRFAVADFNLDGRLDLATCLQATTGVSVFLGNGDGTFAAPLFFDAGNTGTNAGPVFSADLNLDRKPDLVMSTYSGISVLLGEGNGSRTYTAVLPGYSLLAVGDFNGDGQTGSGGVQRDAIHWRRPGNGDGTFKSPQSVFVTSLLSVDRSVVG